MSEGTVVTKELLNRLDVYADKLGVLSTDVFQAVLAQQYIHAWVAIVGLAVGVLIVIALFIFSFVYAKRLEAAKEKNAYANVGDLECLTYIPLVAGGIITFVGGVLFLAEGLPYIVGRFLNPTYYAIKEIGALL